MKGGAFLVGKTFPILCCVFVFFPPPITQHFHILGTHAQLGFNSLKNVIITLNKTKNTMKQNNISIALVATKSHIKHKTEIMFKQT